MSKNGGYVIIDFKDINITSEPVVNSGNYTFTAYGHTFTVTHDDGVTIA